MRNYCSLEALRDRFDEFRVILTPPPFIGFQRGIGTLTLACAKLQVIEITLPFQDLSLRAAAGLSAVQEEVLRPDLGGSAQVRK